MPDSLDDISVLPKMNQVGEKGRTFRLLWALDLVSDSFRSYVTLVFKNTSTNFILVDTIPPELLSYCSVGSHFSEGKKLSYSPGAQQLTFTIKSTDANQIVEAGEAFTDKNFDLSLGGRFPIYSDLCRQQLCFVQNTGGIKIVIPCFVLAGAYYFKSTSLREAVMARRLDSLFHSCIVDAETRHAVIELKSEGNVGDAISIARLKLDPFANRRMSLCKNHHFANVEGKYRRLKADFPVEQDLTITARGFLSKQEDGTETFIIQSIQDEDSRFPFDTIDIVYEKDEGGGSSGSSSGHSRERKGHTGRLNTQPPFLGYLRHLLESSKPIRNKHFDAIAQNKIPVARRASGDDSSPGLLYDKEKTDLSTQPSATGDDSTSKAEVREEEDKRPKLEWTLDWFIQIVLPLRDSVQKVMMAEGEVTAHIEDFGITTSFTYRRYPDSSYLTLKESYDHSPLNRRRCAFIKFKCNGSYVYLVEIDQKNTTNSGCSTRVLIADQEINLSSAEECVKDYVEGKMLSSLKRKLKGVGISMKTVNHPHSSDEITINAWRSRLLLKILTPEK